MTMLENTTTIQETIEELQSQANALEKANAELAFDQEAPDTTVGKAREIREQRRALNVERDGLYDKIRALDKVKDLDDDERAALLDILS